MAWSISCVLDTLPSTQHLLKSAEEDAHSHVDSLQSHDQKDVLATSGGKVLVILVDLGLRVVLCCDT